MPAASESEIRKIIEFQAKQYISLPLSAVTLDWVRVGERTDEVGAPKQQIFLVSIPNEQIQKYHQIFKTAGITLRSVEVEGMSLARALTYGAKKPVLIIDIGSRSTSFSVAQDLFLKFSGQTDFAGGSLTQTIASGLAISPRRAEDLKKQRGMLGFGGEQELSTLILPLVDVILTEAQRVIATFETTYRDTIAEVILSGGGSNLVGIEAYAAKQLKLPVKKADPFANINYQRGLEPITKEAGPLLAVAIGLGMKGFV